MAEQPALSSYQRANMMMESTSPFRSRPKLDPIHLQVLKNDKDNSLKRVYYEGHNTNNKIYRGTQNPIPFIN
jgi:hypothetical protein